MDAGPGWFDTPVVDWLRAKRDAAWTAWAAFLRGDRLTPRQAADLGALVIAVALAALVLL